MTRTRRFLAVATFAAAAATGGLVGPAFALADPEPEPPPVPAPAPGSTPEARCEFMPWRTWDPFTCVRPEPPPPDTPGTLDGPPQ